MSQEELQKFTFWGLDFSTWASVASVLSFIFSLIGLGISLIIQSEVKKIRASYIFDKRINKHIGNLQESASNLNQYLNNYNDNRQLIKTELSVCISELQDIISKLSFSEGWKSRMLIRFMKGRRGKPFVTAAPKSSAFFVWLTKYPRRIYQTSYDDIWIVYDGLIEIIRQIENIKQNKRKSL